MSSLLQPWSDVATLNIDVATLSLDVASLDLVFSMFQLGSDVVTQDVDVATSLLLSWCLQSMSWLMSRHYCCDVMTLSICSES